MGWARSTAGLGAVLALLALPYTLHAHSNSYRGVHPLGVQLKGEQPSSNNSLTNSAPNPMFGDRSAPRVPASTPPHMPAWRDASGTSSAAAATQEPSARKQRSYGAGSGSTPTAAPAHDSVAALAAPPGPRGDVPLQLNLVAPAPAASSWVGGADAATPTVRRRALTGGLGWGCLLSKQRPG